MSGGVHRAVADQDYHALVRCVQDGCDVDEPHWEGDGKTPLHIAASLGNYDMIKLLCERGCDTNVRTIRGETALHLVITSKKDVFSSVDILLDYRCDGNIQENLQGQTPLHLLAKYVAGLPTYADRAVVCLRNLIENSNPRLADARGRTALHHLARSCTNLELIKDLFVCDLTARNCRGETPLHEALENDNAFDVVRLLAANSDLSIANNYGETPLHVVARKRKLSLIQYLVSMGASPNAQEVKGNTPLHLMAERGYLEGVKFLTECSLVDFNLQNNDGLTALHVAVESGFFDVVKLLLEAEACDLTLKDSDLQTALELAQQEYRRRSHPHLSVLLSDQVKRNSTTKF
uniref:Ankyrin-3 n=1 Tax=Lygus hesperus TaxID=30085 RepID=A0A146LZ66_LYGHE